MRLLSALAPSTPRSVCRGAIPLVAALGVPTVIACLLLGADAVGVLSVAVIVIAAQTLLAPLLIRWLVKPRFLDREGRHYLVLPGSSDARLARLMERRCADLALPIVRLGVSSDAEPNAFTFGSRTSNATIVVSQALLDALDDEELDAVLCHELAHIEHRDVALMTAAAVIPVLVSVVGRSLINAGDGDDDDDGGELVLIGLALVLLSFVADLLILSLSRSREYAADRRACEVTRNGDALAMALVIVDRRAGERADTPRLASAAALAFSTPKHSSRYPKQGEGPQALVDRMRAERRSRFGRLMSWFSTHPSVPDRIVALERSGLAGAPTLFGLSTSGSRQVQSEASGRTMTNTVPASASPFTFTSTEK